jgi:hypothetical protein
VANSTGNFNSVFTSKECIDIEHLSEGLTENEVCMYLFGHPYEELTNERLIEFNKLHYKGRTKLKIHAITELKKQMTGKTGLQATLIVLTRFAEAFPKYDGNEGGEPGKAFNFKVVLND